MGFRDVLGRIQEEADETKEDAFDYATDVTGAEEYAESEQAAEARKDIQEAKERGGIRGNLSAFDTATRAGFDFALDNPKASYQDTNREIIEAATGVESEDQGEAAQDLAQRSRGAIGGAIEGTAFDNPVTDLAGKGLDVFVGDPAKAALTAGTGIDTETGETEGTVGAIDAFDIGVTVGTAGVGKAGLSAAKGSDEAAGFLGRLLGGSDEAAGAADEAAQGADEATRVLADGGTDVFNPRNMPVIGGSDEAAKVADEALPAADEGGQVLEEGTSVLDDAIEVSSRVTDEAAQGADEAASVSDDATRAGFLSGLGRAGAGLADETSGLLGRLTKGVDEAARGVDEAVRGADEAAGAADEAAQAADEAVQAADEAPGALSRVLGTTTGKVAAAGGGALAGGALLESLGVFDRLEVTDPQTGETFALIREKQYQPTEERDGGLLFQVKTGSDGTYKNSQGYTVMVGASGRNVYILDGSGNRKRAQVPVETFQEAQQRARGAA